MCVFLYHLMAYRASVSSVCVPRASRAQKYKDGYCKAAKFLHILEKTLSSG